MYGSINLNEFNQTGELNMGNVTIQSTTMGKGVDIEQLGIKAMEFLIANKDLILVPDNDVIALSKMKTFSPTVINEIASVASAEGAFNSIAFFDFSKFKESVPYLLAIADITMDGKTLNGAPPFLEKAWVNLTPIVLKKNLPSDPINISDIPRMQQLVVRSLLSMSYNDTSRWLEPRLISFIIESYSLVAAEQLKIAYNLNFDEMRFVQTLYAVFYAQRLSDAKEDLHKEWPIVINRCGFLGTQSEISEQLKIFEDIVGTDKFLTLERCAEILRKSGPARMSKFTEKIFFQLYSRSNTEPAAMLYALEYPPYWVYLILKALSKDKNPILKVMFDITDLKKKAIWFATELKISKFFIPMVKRNAY